MDDAAPLSLLRQVLTDLYPAEDDSRVVVGDAGISTKRIKFSAKAATNWHVILEEAQRQDKLDALLDVVCRSDYGRNPAFVRALQAYRAGANDQPITSGTLGPLPSTASQTPNTWLLVGWDAFSGSFNTTIGVAANLVTYVAFTIAAFSFMSTILQWPSNAFRATSLPGWEVVLLVLVGMIAVTLTYYVVWLVVHFGVAISTRFLLGGSTRRHNRNYYYELGIRLNAPMDLKQAQKLLMGSDFEWLKALAIAENPKSRLRASNDRNTIRIG